MQFGYRPKGAPVWIGRARSDGTAVCGRKFENSAYRALARHILSKIGGPKGGG